MAMEGTHPTCKGTWRKFLVFKNKITIFLLETKLKIKILGKGDFGGY
jgi:hypothetical protein